MTPEPLVQRPAQAVSSLGISRATLYRLVKKGLLPPPVKLGGRAVGWLSTDVTEFIEARAQERQRAMRLGKARETV
jgi:prophage regulatory protein